MNREQRRRLDKIFSKRRKLQQKNTNLLHGEATDLRLGDKILLHEEIRFCNFDGKLIEKLGDGTILIYKGKRINKLWGDGTKWLCFKTEEGVMGIVNPVAMVNCFTFVEEETDGI